MPSRTYRSIDYFVQMLKAQWNARKDALRAIDERRLAEPDWYRSNKLLGMMLYPANFGGTLKGVQEKLPYLAECGVNYLHLMPLLDSPKGKSDGGYAVSDFRRVRPDLGTMEDLAELADACHEKGMVLCLDFVLNHTSEEHAWAKAAKAGDPVARSRYFFYDTWATPNEFEKTVPQVFPTTAPGNFTQLPDGQIVMTSFYPFQWDLNYSVTDLYAKRISAIDHDYYQNYINRKKFEQLERQRKIIEDEIDWRTNEKCRLENELKNAGIFCNKALIKDRIAFLKAKIDALCKQVSELK